MKDRHVIYMPERRLAGRMKARELFAIRDALQPERISDYARSCAIASYRLVEASQTEGSALSRLWPDARVARGRCDGVGDHSWVVVGDRIVDVTLWSYDPTVGPIHRTTVDDQRYREAR